MKAERQQVANEQRATGAAEAERIKADADKQREVIIADAYKQAQIVKGQGDAKASAIYAAAFGQDPQFYQFYQSLEAYRRSFKNRDVLVADPNSDFFRFLRNPDGTAAPAGAARPPLHQR
jgi:membrane protease subunit HflC